MGRTSHRWGYLDWARGLAVLAMLHTHALYAWTRPEDRHTALFEATRLMGGFPAGLFLFLAGLAAALVGEREWERGRTGREVLRRALRRGALVFAFALLFRAWMFTSSFFAPPADLLRVDVLNCIGLSLVLVAPVVARPTARGRVAGGLLAAAAVALLTPLAWDGSWAARLPAPLAGYLSGRVPGSIYPLFPWAAFALLGAAAGVVLWRQRARGREGRTMAVMAALGAAAVPAGLALDRPLSSLYPVHDFWYTSPAYTLLKVGVVLLLVGAAWVMDRLPGAGALRLMGRTSLLVYWVHIEIVYGKWVTAGARESLPVEVALAGVAALTLAMLVLSLARTRLHGLLGRRRRRARLEPAEGHTTPRAADGEALALREQVGQAEGG